MSSAEASTSTLMTKIRLLVDNGDAYADVSSSSSELRDGPVELQNLVDWADLQPRLDGNSSSMMSTFVGYSTEDVDDEDETVSNSDAASSDTSYDPPQPLKFKGKEPYIPRGAPPELRTPINWADYHFPLNLDKSTGSTSNTVIYPLSEPFVPVSPIARYEPAIYEPHMDTGSYGDFDSPRVIHWDIIPACQSAAVRIERRQKELRPKRERVEEPGLVGWIVGSVVGIRKRDEREDEEIRFRRRIRTRCD